MFFEPRLQEPFGMDYLCEFCDEMSRITNCGLQMHVACVIYDMDLVLGARQQRMHIAFLISENGFSGAR